MASFVAHNLRVLGLGTKSVCQRDLDSMKRIRDYRKPWDRVVPIYHAMLSEGGRVMRSILGFLGTVILLLVMVNYAHADTSREDAERLRAGVVLEAGKIDISTVKVGALVVVIYGQGERHPTSGEWAKLDTARGYIKAVNQRRLIVGLEPDGWTKWIALERIQTLLLIESPSSDAADRNSTQADVEVKVLTVSSLPLKLAARNNTQAGSSYTVQGPKEILDRFSGRMEKTDDMGAGGRIAVKLVSGALLGVGGALGGGFSLYSLEKSGCSDSDTDESPFADCSGRLGAAIGASIGFGVGVPVGVTIWDPHDDPSDVLTGTILGLVAAGVLGKLLGIEENDVMYSISFLVVTPVFATLMSEWSRKPPESRRFSVGLRPDPKGRLSAVATLRF